MSSQALLSFRDIPGPLTRTSNAVGSKVGRRKDTVMSGITMSLGMLKEASSLASKVPCISPIAAMLLYVIQVHDDIRQYKSEWAVVARKIVDIASLVISVGTSCEKLGEEDLVHLQADLQHLQSNLEGIEGVLKECAESPGIKKVLMRQDILLKIKRCDNMLSHALSLFQTKMTLRIHFTQLAQSREVHTKVHTVHAVAVTASEESASSSRTITPTVPIRAGDPVDAPRFAARSTHAR